MKKFFVFFLFFLLLNLFLFPGKSQQINKNSIEKPGKICYESDIISNVSITFKNSRFNLKWLNYSFDISLFLSGQNFEYKIEMQNQKLKFKTKLENGTEREFEQNFKFVIDKREKNIMWGIIVFQIPALLSRLTEKLIFRLENPNFNLKKVCLLKKGNFTYVFFPEGLILSYDDLLKHNFSMEITKSQVSIGNLTGKKEWFLDPIVYTTNAFRITGFSQGNECDLNTIYEWDLNQNFTVLDQAYYESDSTMSLDRPLRPANNLSLYIWVSVVSGGADRHQITFTGKDKDGNNITDTILNLPDGNHSTSIRFASVDPNGVFFDSSGTTNITFFVFQTRFGLMWKLSDYQYRSDACIYVGTNVGDEGWFKEVNKEIYFSASAPNIDADGLFFCWPTGHLTLGILENAEDKSSSSGLSIFSDGGTGFFGKRTVLVESESYSENEGDCKVYSCSFYGYGKYANQHSIALKSHGCKLYNSQFVTGVILSPSDNASKIIDYYNLLLGNVPTNYAIRWGNIRQFDEGKITNAKYGFTVSYSREANVSNIYVRNVTYLARWVDPAKDSYWLNVDSDNWQMYFHILGSGKGKVIRQYELDLKVFFGNGSYIQNANVTISNDYLGISNSFLTDINGSISTQILTIGHFNQTGQNTMYDYNPYNLTITFEGYETYSTLINITRKEDLSITLMISKFTVGLGSGFILAFLICLVLALAGLGYGASKK